jgi:hypothetical protein
VYCIVAICYASSHPIPSHVCATTHPHPPLTPEISHVRISWKRGSGWPGAHAVTSHVTRDGRYTFVLPHRWHRTDLASRPHSYIPLAPNPDANPIPGQQCHYCRKRRQRVLDATPAASTARLALHRCHATQHRHADRRSRSKSAVGLGRAVRTW